MSRAFIGLSIGSGLEGIDAAVVRTHGIGLALAPRPEHSLRIPFSAALLAALKSSNGNNPDVLRNIAESAVQAARGAAVQSGLSARDVFAVGFLDPAHQSVENAIAWSEVAGRIAESTGLTVVHGFRDRDRAAGGAGRPITAVSDFLLFQNDREDRLVIHLGAISGILFIPANAKISAIHGFEVGPGCHWLDAIQFHGTRGKEPPDISGKIAVQGRCLEPLLQRWLEHPYFSREAPKAVPPEAFGRAFLHASFEYARTLGARLPDMLCTANHLISQSIGAAWRTGLRAAGRPSRVLLSGGGVRNGFLWQLLAQQFEGVPIARLDEIGIPAAARKPAAAAILAALTCDGVAGNLAPLTGAAGGRLLGHIVPGDSRQWARCAEWIAEQAGEYPRTSRAA